MLDLDKLHELAKLTVKRVIRDYPEEDKILIDIDEIIQEAVRQHAKALKWHEDMPEMNKGNVDNCSCSWIRGTDNTMIDPLGNQRKVYICENCRRYYIKENGKYYDVIFNHKYNAWIMNFGKDSKTIEIKRE
jgi:hypothetical protein